MEMEMEMETETGWGWGWRWVWEEVVLAAKRRGPALPQLSKAGPPLPFASLRVAEDDLR